MLTLIPDWKRALRGYAFWSAVLGSLTFLIPFIAWTVFELDLDPNLFGWAGLGFTLLGIFGRFVTQPDGFFANFVRIFLIATIIVFGAYWIDRAEASELPGSQVSDAEIMRIAVPFLKRWEGVELEAYRDVVGVWTICSGTTRGVVPGMRKTQGECDVLLHAEALEYWHGVSAAMTPKTLRERITANRGASWTSFAINVGIRAATKSTAMRRLNAGQIKGSCDAMTWFNKAGGKIYRGLVNRRGAEWELCMSGAQA